MKVLSLCDGMSCGQIALKELGIIPEKYYASEIDRYAIAQTQLNFPDTIQLGDIENWRQWNIDFASVDLILAGTPCTGFSFCGKQLAFNDPQSRLFWVFVDILNHVKRLNPQVKFLFENVNMKKEYMRIISEALGIFPVRINSNLVSAQNRDRWYWSNIRTKQVGIFGDIYTDIPQPEDKGILLRDILEEEVNPKYYLSEKAIKYVTDKQRLHKKFTQIDGDKSLCLMEGYQSYNGTFISINGKCKTLRCPTGWYIDRKHNFNVIEVPVSRRNSVIRINSCKESGGKQPYQTDRIYAIYGKSPTLMARTDCRSPAICYDKHIIQRPRGFNKGGIFNTKSPALSANSWEQNNVLSHQYIYRRLTPVECARLQTVPAWYRWNCSNTQAYKMLGNGWTISVITHILSYM